MWRLHFARRYVDIVPEHEDATRRVDEAGGDLAAAEAHRAEAQQAHRLLVGRRDLPEAERSAWTRWDEAKGARERNAQERAVLAAERARIAVDRPRLLGEAEGWDGEPAAHHQLVLDGARKEASDAHPGTGCCRRPSDARPMPSGRPRPAHRTTSRR